MASRKKTGKGTENQDPGAASAAPRATEPTQAEAEPPPPLPPE